LRRRIRVELHDRLDDAIGGLAALDAQEVLHEG
jgi:hypothetical protein